MKLRARHGSYFARTIRAADRVPYQRAAEAWLKANAAAPEVVAVLGELAALMPPPSWALRADDVRWRSPAEKAHIALARLGKAGIAPAKLAATWLGISALILEDPDADQGEEYRLVQVAKAVHRLASGTHFASVRPRRTGETRPPNALKRDLYPRSSGRVLRFLGGRLEGACKPLAAAIPAVIAAKTQRFGPHPSTQPGWLPRWRRELERNRF